MRLKGINRLNEDISFFTELALEEINSPEFLSCKSNSLEKAMKNIGKVIESIDSLKNEIEEINNLLDT